MRFFILCKLFSLVIHNITHFYLCDAMLAYGRVSVSVTNRYSVETVERFGLVLAWELLSTYHTPCFKEIDVHIPSKIRVLPSGTLLQTLDLENFVTAYRSVKHVINLAQERWTLIA